MNAPAPGGGFAPLLASLGEAPAVAGGADPKPEDGGPVRFEPRRPPAAGRVAGGGSGEDLAGRAVSAETILPAATETIIPAATEGAPDGAGPFAPVEGTDSSDGGGPAPFPRNPEGEARIESVHGPAPVEGAEAPARPPMGESPAASPARSPAMAAGEPIEPARIGTGDPGPATPSPADRTELFEGHEVSRKPSLPGPDVTGDRRKPPASLPAGSDPATDRSPEKKFPAPAAANLSERGAPKGIPEGPVGETAPAPSKGGAGFERVNMTPEGEERAEPRPAPEVPPSSPDNGDGRRAEMTLASEDPVLSDLAIRDRKAPPADRGEGVRANPKMLRAAGPARETAALAAVETSDGAPAPEAPPEGPKFERFTRSRPAPAHAGGDPDLPVPDLPKGAPIEEIGLEEMRVRFVRPAAPAPPPRPAKVAAAPARQEFRLPFSSGPALPGGIDGLRAITRTLGTETAGPVIGESDTPVTEKAAHSGRFAADQGGAEPPVKATAEEMTPALSAEEMDGPALGTASGRKAAGLEGGGAGVLEPALSTTGQTGPAESVSRPAPAWNPAGASAGEPWNGAAAPARGAAPTADIAGVRPTVPSPLAFREEILDRIADGMRATLGRGRNEAEIRLDPPELGRVHVKITVSDSSVHGVIHVESAAVKALVEADLTRLGAALTEGGLALDRFDVLLQGERRSPDGRGGDGRRSAGPGRFVEEEVMEPAGPALAAAAGGTGRVDYLF
ncbi:MAG: flagellar hook-length control protein FliK [Candidatus Eisenbacteria bacterium]